MNFNKIYHYIKPILVFYLLGLLIFAIGRIFLFFFFFQRASATENISDIFTNGFRIDLILLSLASTIPLILMTILPKISQKFLNTFLLIYFPIFLGIFLFMEVSTLPFIKQYDTRPNKIFIEYLIYPKEVFNTISKGFWKETLAGFLIIFIFFFFLLRKAKSLFSTQLLAYKFRVLLFPLLGFLLFFGIRSSLISVRPFSAKDIFFSNDMMVNSLALNSTYSLAFAAWNLKNEEKMDFSGYGKMAESEALQRVKKYMNVADSSFVNSEIPLLHTQNSSEKNPKLYNLVIFLQESLGAEYVGHLGGKPLTPNLDKLAKEGMFFTNLFCTGTRSVKGIESVITSFLPSPSLGVLKMNESQENFFTIAKLLQEKGYNTSFIYGGSASFDNMAPFFVRNGFTKIIEQKDYKNPIFTGTWGVSDEDLVQKANEYFKSQGNKPFFSLMFSSSNHEPFEFPDGKIELYEQPKNSVHNAMKYADFAIGKFFELAKKETYYKNTIFVVIADHDTRVYGNEIIPLHKYRIPCVIIAPNIKPNTEEDFLASQIDIAPTAMDYLGLNITSPMVGRNLRQFPKDKMAGRSIHEFNGVYGFRVGNEMIVLQNGKNPLQFAVNKDFSLKPTTVNEELYKDALAHLTLSSYLYQQKKFRLK